MNRSAFAFVAILYISCWVLTHCNGQDQPSSETQLLFVEVTEASGIDFEHTTGASGEGYLVEGVSTGVATFDYDADGLVDIYFINGAPLRGFEGEGPYTNKLYRNLGDMKFEDVTEKTGVGDTGYALGVTIGDYDGDGWPDIYVNNFGPNVLYRNVKGERFEDTTEAAGVGNGSQVGAGAAFLDIEGDGDLDLYVGNYVGFSYETHVPIIVKGKKYTAGPQYYSHLPDTLYRNEGDGSFSDISSESGIASLPGPSMGLIASDFDEDGDTDVYVCNDGEANFLFLNDGKGHFEEDALLSGVANSFTGKRNSSMGVDLGDSNSDTQLDLFSTNYQSEMPNLYLNLGGGLFEDATQKSRITHELFPHVNWGTAFADVDNDGDQDLFIACGHFDRVEQIDDRTSQKLRNYLLRNDDGKFTDVSLQAGPAMQLIESSRAVACEDFDNDGDLDFLIVNSNARPNLIENQSQLRSHWIEIRLRQPGPNPEAVGARVEVEFENRSQVRRVVSGRGYQSHFGTTLHFGLGESPDISRNTDANESNENGQSEAKAKLRVIWPDGSGQEEVVEIDQISIVTREQ